MATIRQRRPGVWEVRGYTGKDVDGKTTQVSRTVYGTKKDARLAAAELTVKPAHNAGGRKLCRLLEEWVEIKTPGWADLTVRDQTSRVRLVCADPIANMSVASIGVSDIDRWVARLRRAGVGEGSIRNQHTVLRSALQQAVRWEWIATNPASNAPIEYPKRRQQRTLTTDEVRAVIAAAAKVHEMAPLAFRLGAEMGARRSELAVLRSDKFAGDKVVVDGQIIVSTDADGMRVARFKPTKTGSCRVGTLSPALLAMAEEARVKFGDVATWLFIPDADPPNPDRIGWWRRSRELAGIDRHWRLHDLRHWSATEAIASGQDARTVANRLGHDPAGLRPRGRGARSDPRGRARGLGLSQISVPNPSVHR